MLTSTLQKKKRRFFFKEDNHPEEPLLLRATKIIREMKKVELRASIKMF